MANRYMSTYKQRKKKKKKEMTESEKMPHGMYVVTKEFRGKIVTERKKAKYIKLKKNEKKKKVVRPAPLKSEKVDRKAYYKKYGHLHPDKTSLDYEEEYRETGRKKKKK